ncbi:MAG TPA: J domain-containing protein [Trebonia sp.]
MRRSGRGPRKDDPFAALGLPARADLSDDDVRSAWRRIAAATHPDRDDGGSPQRYAAAAAAYATLRTPFGRGEARADMAEARATPGRRPRSLLAGPSLLAGRPWRLAGRLLAATAVVAFAFAAAGWSPGTVGVVAGAATWLAATLWRERHGWRRE